MRPFLEAAIPSLGALLFFVIALRALVHADRRERAAAARFEREQDAREAAEARGRAAASEEHRNTMGDTMTTDPDEAAFRADRG